MPANQFLHTFIPEVKAKSRQVNLASWILETTGSKDAAHLKAELETELRLLFNDKEAYHKLAEWDKDTAIADPLLKRQVNVLLRQFIPNQIDRSLVEKIARQEAALAVKYSNFRPLLEGSPRTENDIREILKTETSLVKRREAWEASKEIGKELAPAILNLVRLRNEAAKSLGYPDFFEMQLSLQEVETDWLFSFLDQCAKQSESAYQKVLDQIHSDAKSRFNASDVDLGPWCWAEPFCQEDPVGTKELDSLVEGVDILKASENFYAKMGLDVSEILKRSDNYERAGKNQHAFCIHIDREGDVRTLNNVTPTLKWLETVLHELGHAVYEMGFAEDLPWLLKEPPHMLTTEAMALLAGRQAYRKQSLDLLVGEGDDALKQKAEESLKRRQLIFSRWALVMTYFERELYRNPEQDLQKLWWEIVERFQKVKCKGSRHGCDFAAKFHIGLAPVYYFSYLLGEVLASAIEERCPSFASPETGKLLRDKIFSPGNRIGWDSLVRELTGSPLDKSAWIRQFAS
ncbi:M2 family metallopeptidase [Estrella lausannensis]|uniref:Oligopeptidase n=1 Tax=Estrella lausannensis TaxID=483423 RepID=A0A0H5DPH9_9BACT|nr:M2 family metallopeptidase [Estrella lausannensis]CRX38471.1 Oligopeptidase [Estrella lausannensis]